VEGLTGWLDGMSEDLLKLAAISCYSSFILDKGRSVRKAYLELRLLKNGLE
jgi:hypothetical protein